MDRGAAGFISAKRGQNGIAHATASAKSPAIASQAIAIRFTGSLIKRPAKRTIAKSAVAMRA
jgi:hypothetical protein